MLTPTANDWLSAILKNRARERAIELTASAHHVLHGTQSNFPFLLGEVSKEIDGVLIIVHNSSFSLLHHVCDIGSSRDVPACTPFAIEGFGLDFTAVSFQQDLFAKPRIDDIPPMAPTATSILEIASEEALNAAFPEAQTTTPFLGRNCFLVPPALIRECVGCEGQDPSFWFLTCRNAIARIFAGKIVPEPEEPVVTTFHDDEETEDENEATVLEEEEKLVPQSDEFLIFVKHCNGPSKEYYLSFLTFLWLAVKGKIPHSAFSIAKDILRKKKRAELETQIKPANLLRPHVTFQNPPPSNNSELADALDRFVGMASRQNNTSSKKSPCFENLSSSSKAALLCLCSTDGITRPSSMPPLALELFAYPTVTEATSELQISLPSQFLCSARITGYLVSALYHGRLLWGDNDIPSGGFSAFYLGRRGPVDSLFSTKDLIRHVQLASGSHLSEVDVADFMKKTFSRPTSVDDVLHQIMNLFIICQFYFGTNALITQKVGTWPAHITKHSHVYASLQNSDRDFATKVLYAVDLRVQQVVISCYTAKGCIDDCNFEFVQDFGQIQNSIITRSFNVTVPLLLLNKSSTPQGKEATTNADSRKRHRRHERDDKAEGPRPKSRYVNNPDRSLCIEASEKYSEVFPKGKLLYSELPKFNNHPSCQCCLHWHAKGSCRESGCLYEASHGKASDETKTKFLAFMAKQRKHAKSA